MNQAKIENGRAEFALNAVKNANETSQGEIAKKYKSYARKFPTLVLTNGLAAALAFAVDKGKNEKAWEILYNNLSDWLKSGERNEMFKIGANKSLIETVVSLSSNDYRMMTGEVLALCEWLRRFASGLIEGEADE